MKHTCRHPKLLALLITAVGILLDQATKLLVSGTMELGESIPLLEGVLHITYIHNRGAAFGMLEDNRWVFLVVSTVTIVAITAYLSLTKSRQPLYIISLSMILSGGIGNMIDRLALGYVVDFIDFYLLPDLWKWVFNVADCFVCVGAGILVIWCIVSLVAECRPKKKPTAIADETAEPTTKDPQ